MRSGLGLAFLVVAAAAGAQQRGHDPDAFVPTDFQTFGAWELYCGHFGDPAAEVCDLRRTDILSPRPNFRAMVTSWTYRDGRVHLEVGAERTTTWLGGGIKVDGARVVAFDRCVLGRCILDGREAEGLHARLPKATRLSLAFNDLANAKEIDWELADLRAGLVALEAKQRR